MSHKQTALDALAYICSALDGLAADVVTSHGILTLAQVQATVRCAFQEVEQIQELKRQRRIVPADVTLPSPTILASDEGGEA